MKRNTIKLDEFIAGYIECAMWANLMMYKCEHDENAYECDECDPDEIVPELESADADPGAYDDELTDEARAEIEEDCRNFVSANIFDLMVSGLDSSQCGHDFALTRNGHGAGFWDHYSSATPEGKICDRLSKACKPYGEQTFIVNAQGKVEVL
jgi:hypothetical protein